MLPRHPQIFTLIVIRLRYPQTSIEPKFLRSTQRTLQFVRFLQTIQLTLPKLHVLYQAQGINQSTSFSDKRGLLNTMSFVYSIPRWKAIEKDSCKIFG